MTPPDLRLDLPGDLLWTDEAAWSPVAQSAVRTLDGQVQLFVSAQGGRPISLEATETIGWISDPQAQALQAAAAIPGLVWTVILRGVPRAVVFRHHEPPAVDLRPLVGIGIGTDLAALDDIYWIGTIKLMEV